MCGIVGYVLPRPISPDPERLARMLRSVGERGPDGEGVCLIAGGDGRIQPYRTDRSPDSLGELPDLRDVTAWLPHDVAIAHTRYAVMDRSDDSHQPRVSRDADLVVAFQGEIFNYVELRTALESLGHTFRTAGDVEVLERAFRAWGDDCWSKLNGFWAAAIYDAASRRMILSRDRLGIAPLYFAHGSERLVFGSSSLGVAELLPGGPTPRSDRVEDFVETGLRDFDEHTLFRGVVALRPGTWAEVRFDGSGAKPLASRRYWDLPRRRLSAGELQLREAATLLRDTLASAVEVRLRGDRDVAFQLSGGLDSTSVIALAASTRVGPLPTYTVSVPEDDEEPFARTMEGRFRLERSVLRDVERGMLDDPDGVARLFAEPIQAPSAIAHHRMCARMKSDGFGVTLSGSGGDEALAGYEWEFWPAAKRTMRAEGHHVAAFSYQLALEYGSVARVARTTRGRLERARDRLRRRVGPGGAVPPEGAAPPAAGAARGQLSRFEGLAYDERRAYHLRVAHLPYYLASNDRATLGIPLEHRQPFLDHRVVELGLRMPPVHLFHRGWTKYVLRHAMSSLLPDEIVWRREKVGFPFPVGRVVADAERVRRAALAAYRAEGPDRSGLGFDALLASDPRRLWRACSVGLWLRALR